MTTEQIVVPQESAAPIAVSVDFTSEEQAARAVQIAVSMLVCVARAQPQLGQLVLDIMGLGADAVYQVRGDLKPAKGALLHSLIERNRKTITQRLHVVLNSTREDKRIANYELAKTLAEICLKVVY